jgi:hypothetical protein
MSAHGDISDEAGFYRALEGVLTPLRAAGRLPPGPEAAQTGEPVLLTDFTMQFKDSDELPALALQHTLDRVQSGEDGHRPN